jgi:hypothetical protein
MHDLHVALHGKTADSGNFHDLIEFRAESCHTVLKSYLTSAPGNAKSTSARTQNTIIDIYVVRSCEITLFVQLMLQEPSRYWLTNLLI